MLQTRNGKRTARAAVKTAVDMVEEGLISIEEAIMRVDAQQINQLLHRQIDSSSEFSPIAVGLPASPVLPAARWSLKLIWPKSKEPLGKRWFWLEVRPPR